MENSYVKPTFNTNLHVNAITKKSMQKDLCAAKIKIYSFIKAHTSIYFDFLLL